MSEQFLQAIEISKGWTHVEKKRVQGSGLPKIPADILARIPNLRAKYTVEKTAEILGISPSSVKKYSGHLV